MSGGKETSYNMMPACDKMKPPTSYFQPPTSSSSDTARLNRDAQTKKISGGICFPLFFMLSQTLCVRDDSR